MIDKTPIRKLIHFSNVKEKALYISTAKVFKNSKLAINGIVYSCQI